MFGRTRDRIVLYSKTLLNAENLIGGVILNKKTICVTIVLSKDHIHVRQFLRENKSNIIIIYLLVVLHNIKLLGYLK